MEQTTADLITTADACTLLHIDRSTLIRWVHAGRIEPALKLGPNTGAFLFDRDDVDALAAERAAEAEQ